MPTIEFPRFEELQLDQFELEAWNGGEIYRNEEYLLLEHNGDRVLLSKDEVIEYLTENYEFTLELLDNVAIRKVAGSNG